MIRLLYPPNALSSTVSDEANGIYVLDLPDPDVDESHEIGRGILMKRTRDHGLRTFVQGCHVDQVSFITNLTFSAVEGDLFERAKRFFMGQTVGRYFRYSYFANSQQLAPAGSTMATGGNAVSRSDRRQPEQDWYCIYLGNTFAGDMEEGDGSCNTLLGRYRFSLTVKRWSAVYPLVNDGGDYRVRDDKMYIPPRGPIL